MTSKRFVTWSLAAALAATGCKSGKGLSFTEADKAAAPAPTPATTAALAGDQPASGADAKNGGKQAHETRKVIRTGHVQLVVEQYDAARAKIDAIVAAAGGYVDSTTVDRHQDSISDATIVVRVPETAFAELLPKLRALGEIVSEATNGSDITDQYVDIEARLASARTLEKRLLELASARNGTIDQVLSVERELARVRGEIEGYEGHLRQWNDQIAMSTLTLSIATKRPEIVAAPTVEPSLGQRTTRAFRGSIAALRELGAWIVVDGTALLPWLVFLVPGALLARRIARRFRRQLPEARAREAT